MGTAELIPDADENSPDSELNPNTGLNAEDHAAFEAMQRGDAPEPPPAGDAPGGDGDNAPMDGDGDGDGDDDGDGEGAGDQPRDPAQTGKKDADAGKDPDASRKPRTINYNKHEREKKKLQDALDVATRDKATLAERFSRLDERTKVLLEAINGQAKPAAPAKEEPPADEEPDQNDDPLGHAAWTRRELGRTQERLNNLEKGITTERIQRQTETAEQALERSYLDDVNATASADPTFMPAYEFLRETRYRELGFISAGIDINDPEQVKTLTADEQSKLKDSIVSTFNAEQLMVARNAFTQRRSAARAVYNLAIARGFKAEAPQQQQREEQPGARTPPAPKSAADELAHIREGIDASRSLSDAGGTPGNGLTVESIINMGDDDFEALYASLPKSKLDQLMGK